MSRVAVIVTRCDWRSGREACGLEIEGDPDSLRLAINGSEYVVDLCDTHREQFYAAVGSVAHPEVQTKSPRAPKAITGKRECPYCEDPKSYAKLAQHIARVHPEHRASREVVERTAS